MSQKVDMIEGAKLSEGYQTLLTAKEEVLIISSDKKEAEDKIKDEICLLKQYYKKDDKTLDTAKVKIAVFKGSMDMLLNGGPDKLEEKIELQEEYIQLMKSDSNVMARAKTLDRKTSQEKESKGLEKDAKEGLKTFIDSDVVEALDILANLEISHKKDLLDAENGKSKKTKKDNSELLELVKALKAKLGLK